MGIKALFNSRVSPAFVLIISLVILAAGCDRPPAQPLVEEPPAPQPAASAETNKIPEPIVLPPPERAEIVDAVKRIFNEAVVLDESRQPLFLVGDFNGDASPDLAVALKPAPGKLDQLNETFPKWITRDPLQEVLPKPVGVSTPSTPADKSGMAGVPVGETDALFAIIHGYGPTGWRDREATQTYLLKNVIGTGMQVRSKKEVKGGAGKRPMPRLDGDVISQVLIGESGFLYFSYSGGGYKWYDPKHFSGEGPSGPFHGMKSAN